MIEAKLQQAIQSGPMPETTFSRIEERANKRIHKTLPFSSRVRRTVALAACLLMLIGTVAAAATTEVNYSAWANSSNSFHDVSKLADKHGIQLPEVLNGSLFRTVTTLYVAPKGTTYLEAIKTPAYRWYDVNYGIEEMVQTEHSESMEVYSEYSICFGSTENELYRYVFSLDESGVWVTDNFLPDSYYTQEYKDVTLQMGTWLQYSQENDEEIFSYHHRVVWIDARNQVVFSISKSVYADEMDAPQYPDELTEFAKKLVDLNE